MILDLANFFDILKDITVIAELTDTIMEIISRHYIVKPATPRSGSCSKVVLKQLTGSSSAMGYRPFVFAISILLQAIAEIQIRYRNTQTSQTI